jgi:hypothetical protein
MDGTDIDADIDAILDGVNHASPPTPAQNFSPPGVTFPVLAK